MNRKDLLRSSMAVFGVIFSLQAATAQDWPQWRGEHRDAKSSGFNVPDTWPASLTRKWHVEVGYADATPALVGDKLYVFSKQGDYEVVRSLNVADGSENWIDKYETLSADGGAARHPGARSSPAVAEGKVVTFGVRGVISCYDAVSGKLLWRKDQFPGAWPDFFTSASPMIVNGMCIALPGKADEGGIFAYDLNTGDVKWNWTEDGPAYSSPILATFDGTEMLVAMTHNKIVGLSPDDGEQFFEIPVTSQGNNISTTTPIVDGDTLIYFGGGTAATAVKVEKKGDAFATSPVWTTRENSVKFSPPTLKDGIIYGLTTRSELFATDASNGENLWVENIGERSGFGYVVDAGEVVAAMGSSAKLIFFEPGLEFKKLAEYQMSDVESYSYPVLSGDRVIIQDVEAVSLWTFE